MASNLLCRIFNKKIVIDNHVESIEPKLIQNLSLYMNICKEETKQKVDSIISIFPYCKISNNYKLLKLCETGYADGAYRTLIHHENGIMVHKKQHSIYVFLKETNENDTLEFIENIINTTIAKLLEADNILFLHASCFCKNGEAIAVVGNKNTGKTSILCEMLQQGYDMLSNDKIGISFINQEVKAFGIPSSIGIRLATIDKCFSEENKNKLANLPQWKEVILQTKKDLSQKINISLKDFVELFHCKIVQQSRLRWIIVNEYTENEEKLKIKELSFEKYKSFLESQFVSAVSPAFSYIDGIYRKKKVLLDERICSEIKILKINSNEKNISQLEKILTNENLT